MNNKQLLRELNKANQTITRLKGLLEKQTSRVVDQVKSAKEKKRIMSVAETKVAT